MCMIHVKKTWRQPHPHDLKRLINLKPSYIAQEVRSPQYAWNFVDRSWNMAKLMINWNLIGNLEILKSHLKSSRFRNLVACFAWLLLSRLNQWSITRSIHYCGWKETIAVTFVHWEFIMKQGRPSWSANVTITFE